MPITAGRAIVEKNLEDGKWLEITKGEKLEFLIYVKRMDTSYQVTSHQLPVTRRIFIRQMNKDIKKGEKEDTCLII